MSKSNFGEVMFGIAGLVGIGCAIGAYIKVSKISKKLDKSIDDLADDMEIDISEEVINEAVEKAVKVEVEKAVSRATSLALKDIRNEIHTNVTNAVNDEYDSLKDSVLNEIAAEAAKIDVTRVRRDVEKAANEAALKKFDDNLDDILKKFNDSLDNTSRIYSSFFTYDETLPQARKRDFWRMACSMGADLSQGDDFCSFVFLFPLSRGEFGIKTRNYYPRITH